MSRIIRSVERSVQKSLDIMANKISDIQGADMTMKDYEGYHTVSMRVENIKVDYIVYKNSQSERRLNDLIYSVNYLFPFVDHYYEVYSDGR